MNPDKIRDKWVPRGPLSLWVYAFIFGSAAIFGGGLTLIEHQLHGGTYQEDFWAAMAPRPHSARYTLALTIFSVALFAGLLWFTFYSQSSLVSENDKRYVRIWTAGIALAAVVTLVRYILRAI
jgi:hypothetical protein